VNVVLLVRATSITPDNNITDENREATISASCSNPRKRPELLFETEPAKAPYVSAEGVGVTADASVMAIRGVLIGCHARPHQRSNEVVGDGRRQETAEDVHARSCNMLAHVMQASEA
jgi:hypothetical protein